MKALRFDLATMIAVCGNSKRNLKVLFLGFLGYRTYDNLYVLLASKYAKHKASTKITSRSYITCREETLKAMLAKEDLIVEYLLLAGSRSYFDYTSKNDTSISIHDKLLDSLGNLLNSGLAYVEGERVYLAPENYTFDKW